MEQEVWLVNGSYTNDTSCLATKFHLNNLRKRKQRNIWAFLECVALNEINTSIKTRSSSMKGTGFPCKMPMFDTMRATKEVHSIGLIILKFVSNCFTNAFVGETRILLTMAYNIFSTHRSTLVVDHLLEREWWPPTCALNEESDSECHCTEVQTCHEQLDLKSNPKTHGD